MLCCGADRIGNFCQECGKPLRLGPAAELRQHLSRMLASANAEVERRGRNGIPAGVMKARLKAERYQAWLAWVDQQLARPDAIQPEEHDERILLGGSNE